LIAPTSLNNQIFFQTKTLSHGQHKLIVTYQGNSSGSATGTAPLALEAFVVQNATSSATTSAYTSVPWSSSPNSTSNLDSNKAPLIGTIVGVVGGVIVLVLLLLLYIRRRRRRRAQKSNPEPFTLSPQNHTSEVQSQPFSSKSKEPTDVVPGKSIPTPPPPGARTNTNDINPAIRNTETMPLMQPLASTSAQDGDLGFVQHADSGVRMPHVQRSLVELPPAYTIG
jgi:hypothetical protein